MKWSEVAIQDLKRYSGLKNSLETIPERIEALELQFTCVAGSAPDKIVVQNSGQAVDDKMLDNIVQRERLKLTFRANKVLVDLIERGLSALNDTERKVLECFYMYRCRGHVERLMDDLGYEKTAVYEIKDRALYQLTTHMYGLQEY